MPMGHRKTPFSGKQKKEQLKKKRDNKDNVGSALTSNQPEASAESDEKEESKGVVVRGYSKSFGGTSSLAVAADIGRTDKRRGRYALKFREESGEEIVRSKREARETIVPKPKESLESASEDFFVPGLDFPTRPAWSYEMSPQELEANEGRYFEGYLNEISEKYPVQDISFFELNLETWRQLWRVLELSDTVLHVVDVRFPVLLFPPKIYEYINERTEKRIVLVLNKIDLAPPGLTVAWKNYFEKKFKGLKVALFCSSRSGATRKRIKRETINTRAAKGALEICKICEQLSPDIEFSDWRAKLEEAVKSDNEVMEEVQVGPNRAEDALPGAQEKRNELYTIGCIGQPNVGKSSLINALCGKKVVSVSKTPGHTKHFQTIFLVPGIRLCDCPGLVFPSRVPKSLQVLSGSFPIAQLREPYSAIKYLAEHLDLPNQLGITHPDGEATWSPLDICGGWAVKRGFYTAKAARPDTYRAANHLLRLALEGKICLNLVPPGYTEAKEHWANHVEKNEVLRLLELGGEDKPEIGFSEGSDSEPDDDTDSSDTEGKPNAGKDGFIASVGTSYNKFAALEEGDEDEP